MASLSMLFAFDLVDLFLVMVFDSFGLHGMLLFPNFEEVA
jgi:hypothetical protein